MSMTQVPDLCSAPAPSRAQRNPLQNLLQDEAGQDLIEYALVCSLVALGAIVSLHGLSTRIANVLSFTSLTSTLSRMF